MKKTTDFHCQDTIATGA